LLIFDDEGVVVFVVGVLAGVVLKRQAEVDVGVGGAIFSDACVEFAMYVRFFVWVRRWSHVVLEGFL
jgi:hypothetical protein